jgi:hypothetical protein
MLAALLPSLAGWNHYLELMLFSVHMPAALGECQKGSRTVDACAGQVGPGWLMGGLAIKGSWVDESHA